MNHLYTTLLLVVCFIQATFSQPIYRNQVHTPEIHTLQIAANSDFMAPTIIELNTDQYIDIEFDDLSDKSDWISYRIIHCNADWRRSQLSELDYLDGFNQNMINDVQPSFNTFTSYYHYRIQLPNPDARFRVSGNYAVEFFRDSEPQEVIATACFSVFEHETEVTASVSTNTDLSFNDRYQQVSVRLHWKNNFLTNPANELKVVVSQNNRCDNEVTVNTPTRFNANEVVFEHNRQLIFKAGNNYRRFETVSNKYAGIGVEKIIYAAPIYHVKLFPTEIRSTECYFYDQDQNGRFVIRQSEAQESQCEADYFMVHFYLNYDNPLIPGSIYLNGDFTNNLFDESTKMVYNFDTRRYEKSLLLKQGHYNYQYLFVPYQASEGETALIEGDHYETGNEYLIKVYHRSPGQRYDRLIGFCQLNN